MNLGEESLDNEPEKRAEDEVVVRESPQWAEKLSKAPEWATTILFMLAGAFLSPIFTAQNFWTWILLALAVVLTSVAGFLTAVRNERENDLSESYTKRLKSEKQALNDEQEEKLRRLDASYMALLEEMALSTFMVAGALKDMRKEALAHSMEIVQKAVLQTVRNRLGPETGVRSCLFVVDPENTTQLKAWRLGEDGRLEPPSTRVFKAGDKTFDLAIAKLERFVEDVNELKDAAGLQRPLRYETFAAYPVSTDEKLYGILTIDAPQPGDIGGRDRALLGFFAAILTITFSAQKDLRAIPRDSVPEI
ncbi:GAF domain-containing protein [Corynebacterium cystitidis]|uniref:GAF domain-containing protein n=1 Tax=Corynebacterium cystitidis TaxID=35757 RepID=UPI00211E6E72|nr:GAF domain-containing protein [Corynebacterium cystitidis]